MNETGMLSYEIGLSKMQEMHKESEKRQILNSVKQKRQKKPFIQKIVQNITARYHAYEST